MIRKLATSLRRWAGHSEAERAAQPLLAGYRGFSTRSFRLLILAALASVCVVYGFAFGLFAPARMMPFFVPIVLLGGLILWCLPPGRYAPVRAMEPLFLAFFAALILWPNYLAFKFGNLPWITMLRLTGTPLAIALLACISISRRFRAHLWEILAAEKVVFRLVMGLAALWTFSIVLSSDPGQSINLYLLAMVNLVGIFLVSAYLFSRPGFADVWVRMYLTMLMVLCVMAFWEYRIQSLPWSNHVPSFLKIEDPVVQKILSAGVNRLGIYRVSGTSTTPLGFGELLGLGMPFAVHFMLGRYKLPVRVAAGFFVPISAWVILLTDSRLGFVAGCASVLFYMLIWAMLRWRRDRSSLFAPALVLGYPAIFIAFMVATFTVQRLKTEFWGTSEQQYSTQSRIEQWEMGVPKILRNPIGNGIGQAAESLGWTNLGGVLTIDSYWLSILLEIGVLGFIVFYGLMLRAAYTAARIAMNAVGDREIDLLLPMSVAILNFVIMKMVFSQEANHPLIFMMLGGIVALAYRAGKQQQVSGDAAPAVALKTGSLSAGRGRPPRRR